MPNTTGKTAGAADTARGSPPAVARPSGALLLRRVAGGVILLLVVGLSTCQGLWSAATAVAAGSEPPVAGRGAARDA